MESFQTFWWGPTFIYRHESAVSCLVPLCSLHGKAVTTVEGVGSIENGLHPVQVSNTFKVTNLLVMFTDQLIKECSFEFCRNKISAS